MVGRVPQTSPDSTAYAASRIRRVRATRSEMEARADFLLSYAALHGPVTVRGLYYQSEVAGMPPDQLRAMVRRAIEQHLPSGELQRLKEIEALERQTLMNFIGDLT